MKKLNVILLVLGIVFLAFLVWTIGAQELWRELKSLGWGLFPFILGEGISEMIHTLGWRHCLNPPYRSLSWWRLFQIRMAGYAINYLTPTASLGGEVTKAALLASNHRGPGAVSGVLAGKVCFGFAHVLFVLLGSLLILRCVVLPPSLWMAMLFSGLLVAGGIVTFFFLQKHGKLGGAIRWLAARKAGGQFLEKAARNITGVDEALRAFFRDNPWDMWLAVGWHLVGYSVGIAQTWFFFHLLAPETPLRVAAAAWFLGMWFDLLTFAVPLNAGSLEGSRILALKAMGYSSLLGMTYGVALRLAQICCAGLGLVAYGSLTAGKNKPPDWKTTANPGQPPVNGQRVACFDEPPRNRDLNGNIVNHIPAHPDGKRQGKENPL